MYTMGIDIGSASSKAVILQDGKNIVESFVAQAGTGTSGPNRVMDNIKSYLKENNLSIQNIKKIVATGYGRFNFEKADKQISEISCHAKGVHFLIPKTRTILDIGGQDAKAISLDENGRVKQFFMNDKCAAGTGRFLDVMSRVLEIPLEKMGQYDKLADNPVNISSTCTVFAESEVISQLSKGVSRENIIAGVHNSTAHKVSGLIYRVGLVDELVMCGGVAKNSGVVRAINEQLERNITIAPNPQITGALGAAVFAYEDIINNK